MNQTKRKFLKSGAALSLVAVALPDKWATPVLKTVLLPAHAQTSAAPSQCRTGFIEAPVNESILITVTGTEVSGPIMANLIGAQFASVQTSSQGLCSNNVDELSETIEFSGEFDAAQNSISGDIVIRQFCSGVLACEQITTYTVIQTVVSSTNDGEYQGTLVGTLNCCQDFL